jgi:hypothetical protein
MKKLISLFLILFLSTSNLFAGTLEMDRMEYATDALTRASWVSNDATLTYGADVATGSTVTSDNYRSCEPNYLCDDNNATAFSTNWDYSALGYVKFQLASAKTVQKYTITYIDNYFDGAPAAWTLYGSNDNSNWTALDSRSGQVSWSAWETRTYTFTNTNSYTYYKYQITGNNGRTQTIIAEFTMHEVSDYGNLQPLSEGATKTEGSNSLKITANTSTLNKTVTRTFSINSNLAGVKNLKLDARALRTGGNFKIGLHDTGGTTTEITPNIATSNTWQPVNWNLSSVADTDKDNIDTCTITIIDANSANVIYLDAFEIAQAIDVFGLVN